MIKAQDSRLNTHLADLVDRCIVLAESDRDRAIAVMMAAAVPDRVIARVLCEPEQRRITASLP